MDINVVNSCGPLESKLIDLATGAESTKRWIGLTSLTQMDINSDSDVGVFNFRVQFHDSTDLVNPVLTSDFEVTLLDPCQTSYFRQITGS